MSFWRGAQHKLCLQVKANWIDNRYSPTRNTNYFEGEMSWDVFVWVGFFYIGHEFLKRYGWYHGSKVVAISNDGYIWCQANLAIAGVSDSGVGVGGNNFAEC